VLNAQCYKNYLARCKIQFILHPNFVTNTNQATVDLLAQFFQTTYSAHIPVHQSCPYAKFKSNLIFCPLISENSLLLSYVQATLLSGT